MNSIWVRVIHDLMRRSLIIKFIYLTVSAIVTGIVLEIPSHGAPRDATPIALPCPLALVEKMGEGVNEALAEPPVLHLEVILHTNNLTSPIGAEAVVREELRKSGLQFLRTDRWQTAPFHNAVRVLIRNQSEKDAALRIAALDAVSFVTLVEIPVPDEALITQPDPSRFHFGDGRHLVTPFYTLPKIFFTPIRGLILQEAVRVATWAALQGAAKKLDLADGIPRSEFNQRLGRVSTRYQGLLRGPKPFALYLVTIELRELGRMRYMTAVPLPSEADEDPSYSGNIVELL